MKVLDKKEFLNRILQDNPYFQKLDLIDRAYDFCLLAHSGQTRKSGEPYAIHPISVALEVSKLNIDEASVVAALLHDVIEDTIYKKKDIEREFSGEIANIVEGVTKFDKIQFKEKDIRQVENFRKLCLALSKDVRVAIIKLCDRLHNMNTIEYQKPEKQKEIAFETLWMYSGLAEQIGLQKIKNDLQNMSFKILYPDEYSDIVSQVNQLEEDFKSKNVIEDIIDDLDGTMKSHEIMANITGRKKTPYSIWNKMRKKNIPFEEVSDIMAFRVIVGNIEDCYRALGAIHTTYNVIPGKFKDFISLPKSNGYRSLHTKIMGPKGRIVDIQIRTQQMHEEDEYGLAAHWQYKQGLSREEQIKYLKSSWINRVVNILQNSSNNDVLQDAQIELDERRVVVFTKDGKAMYLPYKSTILDFAFELGEKIGLHFEYAVVNGQIVGMDYVLNNGDKIDIKTTNKPQISNVWLNYTITGKSRNAIIEYLGQKK